MNLIDALNASECDCAQYVNENGIAWNVDGSGDGWYVTSGQEGMPPTDTKQVETRDAAIAYLPGDIATSEKWEAIESE